MLKKSIALLVLMFVAGEALAQGMPPAQVEIMPATKRALAPRMEVTGTVISLNDSRIPAEVEGPLVWIADVGTIVSAGDVIARIDDRLIEVNYRRAQANLKRMQADLTFREQDVARFEELASRDNASKARLEEVIARREMLRQEFNDAEAIFERARGDLERTLIKAPFNGAVVRRLASIGEFISVGEEVIRLVDTENLEVAMPAPLSIRPFVTAGSLVDVYGGMDEHMQLPVRTAVPVGDQVSRVFEVRLSLAPGTWIVGTPLKISLPSGPSQEVVAVRRDALVQQGSNFFVYLAGEDNTAQQVPVEVQIVDGLWVSVSGGLKEGDRVIFRGAERIMPGQPIMIIQ